MFLIGIGFTLLSIGFISNLILKWGQLFQEITIFISFILLILFTNLTFHKERKILPSIVLIIIITLGLVQIGFYFYSVYGIWTLPLYYLRVALDFPYTFITFNWLAYSSLSAFIKVKSSQVEPWVKWRYKMVAFFSLIFSFHSLPEFFQPPGTTWADTDNIISLLLFGITASLVVMFSLGFALAWIMPNRFRNYLNKNYSSIEDIEYREKELIDNIKKELNQKEK
jgi:hypothetical protein